MKTINVVAAIIRDAEGRIFSAQRGYGEWKGWYKFPGGKIEAGETPQEDLKREIREELQKRLDVLLEEADKRSNEESEEKTAHPTNPVGGIGDC